MWFTPVNVCGKISSVNQAQVKLGGLQFSDERLLGIAVEGRLDVDLRQLPDATAGGEGWFINPGLLIRKHDHFMPARKMRRGVKALTARNYCTRVRMTSTVKMRTRQNEFHNQNAQNNERSSRKRRHRRRGNLMQQAASTRVKRSLLGARRTPRGVDAPPYTLPEN